MIGTRLRKIRKEKGLSQQALADALSTAPGYISEIEKGKKKPGSDFLSKLKRVFGINIDWFLTGDELPIDGQLPIDDDPEIAELLEGARRVLKSGNPIAFDALERNIRYFDHAVAVEKRLALVEEKLETALDALAKTQDALNALVKMKEMKKAANE
jgi:transcriptional regulator with XRE-family HTH domain